jgi:hypothetical protein
LVSGTGFLLHWLFEDSGSWLQFRSGASSSLPEPPQNPTEVVVEALQLYNQLGRRFGTTSLLERAVRTLAGLNLLSWILHVLMTLQGAQLRPPDSPTRPYATVAISPDFDLDPIVLAFLRLIDVTTRTEERALKMLAQSGDGNWVLLREKEDSQRLWHAKCL